MSRKNETPVLIASLLITVGLLGGGVWWFTRNGNLNLGSIPGVEGDSASSNTSSVSSAPSSTGNTLADVPVPTGLFNYGGSTTWAPIRGTVDPLITQTHSAFQLRYTDPIGIPPGSGAGIEMLLNNQLSFAQSSRPISPDERQQAEAQGYTLKEIPVVLEGIAIAVNPGLPVEGITLDQLRDIYSGQLTNWSQLGGPDLAILPVSRSLDGGTVEFFTGTVLGGVTLASTVSIANSTTEALRFVSDNPGSIYYASAPEVVGQCTVKPISIGRQPNQLVKPYTDPYVPPENCPAQRNQINSEALRSGDYPLTRRLFVIVREDGQLDQQAGEAYANLLLTQQGQTLLNQAGFVPIR
ncbi:MAG: PstS family phosphate ABC transporter substrate-binding protein [Leptolyngbya sp. SIO1D8]|nr:PstS family phosphate ABC transporter substrate-binding protein [Leptolyngbya sp. SIO1D8]